jgi:hypothetical protein
MGVRVQAGTMRIPSGTAPANFWYEAAIDTASPGEALTVTTANPSNPRRDLVVAYIDKAVTPSTAVTNNSNSVLKLAVVAGTAASSPSDPTSSQITTTIGASNPYIILARITVGTGVTQITNSDITDLRQMMGVNRLVDSPWQSWTRIWTNLAVGASTVNAKYSQVGKTVRFRISVTLGGTNAPTGSVAFTLPVPSVPYPGVATTQPIGTASYNDSSSTVYDGRALWQSITTAILVALPANGNWSTYFNINATNPFAFGVGDEIFIQGEYEAA